jgi:hypothetical protein
VVGDYLYIPKFKRSFPSEQQLYKVDIATGAIADSITVLTSEQDGNTVFESIGQFTNANGETEYYLIGAPNSRITDANYKAENDSKGHMAWYTLKFTDNGISAESKTSYNLTKRMDSQISQQITYGNFFAYYDTDYEAPRIVFNGMISNKDLGISSTYYTDRLGYFLDRLMIAASMGINKTFIQINNNLYGVKSQFRFLTDQPKTTSNFLVNFAKESTEDINYGPAILNASLKQPITSLGLEGEGVRGGDAIELFTLYGNYYLIYSSEIKEDKSLFKIVKLPNWTATSPSFTDAAEMWEIPLAVADKSNADGESITAIAVETSADESGNEYADIYLYAQGQGLARYRMQEYYGEPNAVSDITVNADNATWSIDNNVLSVNTDTPSAINVYNALGACVAVSANNQINISSLASGMYIAKCGAHAYKFVIK